MEDLDNLDQPEEDEVEAPKNPAPDLEALVRSVLGDTLKSELDSRFSGLQSMQDKRLAALAKELRQTSLTAEQQEDLMEREEAKETAKALQIAELIKRRKNAPEAVDFMLESMEKADLDDQLAYIQSVLGAKAAKSVAKAVEDAASEHDAGAADSETEIPESDKNNPRSSRSSAVESGDEMDEELADTVLNRIGRGEFRSFFGRR